MGVVSAVVLSAAVATMTESSRAPHPLIHRYNCSLSVLVALYKRVNPLAIRRARTGSETATRLLTAG